MISLSMPLTATDFAVRLSPLKISYFFLPAASDGLIFVSEVHFALKLLSYGNIFLLCFPLFFVSAIRKPYASYCGQVKDSTCHTLQSRSGGGFAANPGLSAEALSHILVMAYLGVWGGPVNLLSVIAKG